MQSTGFIVTSTGLESWRSPEIDRYKKIVKTSRRCVESDFCKIIRCFVSAALLRRFIWRVLEWRVPDRKTFTFCLQNKMFENVRHFHSKQGGKEGGREASKHGTSLNRTAARAFFYLKPLLCKKRDSGHLGPEKIFYLSLALTLTRRSTSIGHLPSYLSLKSTHILFEEIR